MPNNPRNVTDRDVQPGTLPTPSAGQTGQITPGSLPANVSTKPDAQGRTVPLTDNKGNLIKKNLQN